jgi:hypothetical protein
MRGTVFTLCLILCASSLAESDWHTWGAVVTTGDFLSPNTGMDFWMEGQGRFNDDTSRFNQGIVRAALGYRLAPRTTIWAGYGFIPNNPRNRREKVIEHRAWQQLTWRAEDPIHGFSLSTRTRLEQRTIEGFDDLGWRFRQFVKLTYPLPISELLYLSFWDELFLNVDDTDWGAKSGVDQNRILGGLGIKIASQTKFEIVYMHQFVKRERRVDGHNHILSFTVLHRF